MAVAHSILVIVYYILKRGEDYQDLGVNHYQEIDQSKVGLEKRYVKRLEKLGYEVNLKRTG